MMTGFFWDYIYYRMVQVNYKWDGKESATALVGVSMIQAVSIVDIILLGLRVCFSTSRLSPYSKKIGYLSVLIFIIISACNDRIYKNKYESIRSRWVDETSQERFLKGILVVLCLILPWTPLIWLGFKK